jgi:hypothetical protein
MDTSLRQNLYRATLALCKTKKIYLDVCETENDLYSGLKTYFEFYIFYCFLLDCKE